MKRLKKIGIMIILAGGVIGAYMSQGSAMTHTLDRAFSVIAYPLLHAMSYAATPFIYLASWWQTTEELEARLSLVQNRLETLRAENVSLYAQHRHYKNIEEVLDFKKRYEPSNGITASVIGKHLSSDAHSILVDAGSAQGIELEMVAVYKNILVGRVSKVYPFYSQVILITDCRCRVPARCVITGTQSIHEGMNSSEVTRLNFISHLETVQPGEMVITSGQGLIFPAGFGLGSVKHIGKDQLGLHLIIDVEPFLQVHTLKAVTLIHKGITLPA